MNNWIKHDGGECPVDDKDMNLLLDIKLENGTICDAVYAYEFEWSKTGHGDIIEYRLHDATLLTSSNAEAVEPFGYLLFMKKGGVQFFPADIDPQDAFYSEPSTSSVEKTVTVYTTPQPLKSPVDDSAEQVQWRNIKNVVRQLADFCFESKDHPKYGSAWLAIVDSLTAKDGIQSTLEPLPRSKLSQDSSSTERFYFDHGLWHDKETGQHLYTEWHLDEAKKDAVFTYKLTLTESLPAKEYYGSLDSNKYYRQPDEDTRAFVERVCADIPKLLSQDQSDKIEELETEIKDYDLLSQQDANENLQLVQENMKLQSELTALHKQLEDMTLLNKELKSLLKVARKRIADIYECTLTDN